MPERSLLVAMIGWAFACPCWSLILTLVDIPFAGCSKFVLVVCVTLFLSQFPCRSFFDAL